MFEWSAEYCWWLGAPLATLRSTRGPWSQVPGYGVVRVHIWHGELCHTLGGMDNYWIDEDRGRYGMFNDPHNRGWYEGRQAIAYEWLKPNEGRVLGELLPPDGAHVAGGIMLPDWYAREVGLIGPDDSSPPRPG